MKNCRALFVTVMLALTLTQTLTAQAKEKEHGMGDVHIHMAEFTGYYPDSSTMEGGYKSANGEWLDPSEYTIAAPKCIPFGSEVTFGGIGNWRDGVTYRVNDRGGAIVVDENGIYHIDILMAGPEQANKFGRRRGYIIVRE